MPKYNIYRFYEDQREPTKIAQGFTLKQARHFCGLESSTGNNAWYGRWFYGFQKEKQ
jgi:hypothetical protein